MQYITKNETRYEMEHSSTMLDLLQTNRNMSLTIKRLEEENGWLLQENACLNAEMQTANKKWSTLNKLLKNEVVFARKKVIDFDNALCQELKAAASKKRGLEVELAILRDELREADAYRQKYTLLAKECIGLVHPDLLASDKSQITMDSDGKIVPVNLAQERNKIEFKAHRKLHDPRRVPYAGYNFVLPKNIGAYSCVQAHGDKMVKMANDILKFANRADALEIEACVE